MFYPENQKKRLDEKTFRNPPCEYRAAPFWAWNCDLNKDLLLREIDQMKRMGMGGFHTHVRTGMSTTYLSDGFMQLIRDCVDKAKEERMRAYLYDEDRWASGAAGGYVTREERYRARYLLFTTVSYEQAEENPASVPVDSPRTGKGRLLARYAVRLNDEGELAEYRLLKDGQQADAAETAWYAYLEIEKESPWFNNQTYVNTLDKKAIEGINPNTDEPEVRHPSDDEPFSALAFKIMTDPYVGRLTFFRVYSGKLTAGSSVLNATKGKRERMGRILQMHANHREDIDTVYAGDIAAVVGLKNTTTGDTLCDESHPIILESMEFPEPVIRVAIEPKTKAGEEKMTIALMKLAEEDPTFRTYTDEETGQTIIAGMGELHLEIIVDRLLREFKVEANVGAPQVAYKETIRKAVDQETKYSRQTGGKGQYGHVKIHVEPNESGKGYEFENKVVGGAIPKEYIPAVDAGIRGAMLSGTVAGYPVVDVKVTLYDGSYHEVDSSEMAFKIAGSMAFKEAMRKADPTLLEPIMKVCVIVPDEYMGDVIGDLNSRRGQIQGYEMRSGAQQIDAFVPLAEMFGYATDLRSRTQGRGQYTMEPSHYIELPKSLQEKLINKRAGRENY